QPVSRFRSRESWRLRTRGATRRARRRQPRADAALRRARSAPRHAEQFLRPVQPRARVPGTFNGRVPVLRAHAAAVDAATRVGATEPVGVAAGRPARRWKGAVEETG